MKQFRLLMLIIFAILCTSCGSVRWSDPEDPERLRGAPLGIGRVEIILPVELVPEDSGEIPNLIGTITSALNQYFIIDFGISLDFSVLSDLFENNLLSFESIPFTRNGTELICYRWINPDPPLRSFEIYMPLINGYQTEFDVSFYFRSPEWSSSDGMSICNFSLLVEDYPSWLDTGLTEEPGTIVGPE
jgi:hypothetical protein